MIRLVALVDSRVFVRAVRRNRSLLASTRRALVLGPHHGSRHIWLGVIRPVAVLADPVGMVGGNPARILVVPPLTVMPVVLPVVRAVGVAPVRIPRTPVGMFGA